MIDNNSFMAGALFGSACTLGVVAWLRHKLKKAQSAFTAQEEQPTTKPAQQWHAMPCGTRLELGSTGFWIELVGKQGRAPFYGYDPEGDVIIKGPALDDMKAQLEKQAKFREEFAPVQGGKPWQ